MIGVDLVLINLGFALAYLARYILQVGGELLEENYVSYSFYLPIALLLTLITLVIFSAERLYTASRGGPTLDEFYTIVSGTTVAIAVIVVITFGVRPYSYSRLMLAYAWLLIILFLTASRLIESWIVSVRRRKGIGVERVLIVGAGTIGRRIMQSIIAQPESGYQVVGFVDDNPAKQEDIGRCRALGTTSDIPSVVAAEKIDAVFITLPWMSHQKIMDIMAHCQALHVNFRVVPDLFQLSLSLVDVDEIGGIPLIGIKAPRLRDMDRWLKRVIDVILATLGLILAAPIMLLAAIAIRLESAGPVIFPQARVGEGGRLFTVYKFRSMQVGAEAIVEQLKDQNETGGITFKMRNDPRLTKVGRILRRFSIDELPQLYNILRGEMSMVGPRPALPNEVAQYEEWHRQRLAAVPGLTGLWQVSGRSDVTFDEMVMMDIYYVENWSIWFDLKIMLRTIPTVLSGRGAY